MKTLIAYYSLYGHVKALADAIGEGASEVSGNTVEKKRIPETLPPEIIEQMGATEAQKQFSSIPEVQPEDLTQADLIFLGSPTRYGNLPAQVATFLDQTGGIWLKGALVGKVGSAFSSSATQHGGNEMTLGGIHRFMLHQGMVLVGLPYSFAGQMITTEVTGGSPYGITTVAGTQGERMPSDNELQGARFQGKHAAGIAAKMLG
ncbi:MAG: NAD(P)H:quinone oxidoreductase [Chitinivibrionales bacterium]|nr:NAD(P)H:quinone oxidoreductase [Chitinivibrionales bacterium]MBD3358444.1 NAD(P)H:quinone oxidoreductase [Chitinivibrionales bacterium]